MRKLKDILTWVGLILGCLGVIVILGACGGIENGTPVRIGLRYVLLGDGMMVVSIVCMGKGIE